VFLLNPEKPPNVHDQGETVLNLDPDLRHLRVPLLLVISSPEFWKRADDVLVQPVRRVTKELEIVRLGGTVHLTTFVDPPHPLHHPLVHPEVLHEGHNRPSTHSQSTRTRRCGAPRLDQRGGQTVRLVTSQPGI